MLRVQSKRTLNEHIGKLIPLSTTTAYSVDGSSIAAIGQMPKVITMGDITIEDSLHVFPKIPGGMLLSWEMAKRLHILPKNYPAQICKTTSAAEVTAVDLIQEFSSLFDDQVRVMDGKIFCIHLKDGSRPFCVTASRMIPHAYSEKVQEEFQTLQSQGVIAPVTEPTDWCAPIVVALKKL